jgi:methyltransferase-like protein/2-polyprenyl-3-methyl-5-hydroxy-6-metoxy-1,4-benzoquinol methylase
MATVGSDQYDEVPYPSYTHRQTHPDRLAVIATLLGMQPASVDRCRVLELGCGDGSNLVPMAMSLPESKFLGIDRAAHPIQIATEVVASLGLKNVNFRQLDLLDLPGELGTFDYIIAHGVYAWVPDNVKEKILSACKSHLKPQGVAFVSYNAYPGGHISDMLRNMCLFHLRDISGSEQRIKQSVAFLKFLAESQTGSDAYSAFVRDELKQTLEFEPAFLYHDRLGTINTPLYFFQFVDHAARHELQFLGEADFTELQYHNYPPETVKLLDKMSAESVILKEQYLDFLKCRRFRQTLLCHAEVKVNHQPDPRFLREMFIASRAQPVATPIDLTSEGFAEFVGPRGGKVGTDYPVAKAALMHLAGKYPEPLAFPSLLEAARKLIGGQVSVSADDEAETLAEILLRIYGTGLLDLYTRGPGYVTKVSERPVASPLARFQLERGLTVSNLRHANVELEDDLGREMLKLLDGTRDRGSLLEGLTAAVVSGRISVSEDGQPVRDLGSIRSMLGKDLETNLQKLAKLALLVA